LIGVLSVLDVVYILDVVIVIVVIVIVVIVVIVRLCFRDGCGTLVSLYLGLLELSLVLEGLVLFVILSLLILLLDLTLGFILPVTFRPPLRVSLSLLDFFHFHNFNWHCICPPLIRRLTPDFN